MVTPSKSSGDLREAAVPTTAHREAYDAEAHEHHRPGRWLGHSLGNRGPDDEVVVVVVLAGDLVVEAQIEDIARKPAALGQEDPETVIPDRRVYATDTRELRIPASEPAAKELEPSKSSATG